MSDNFYAAPGHINGSAFCIEGDQARHIATVLRYRPGEAIDIFNGAGSRYRAIIRKVSQEKISGEIKEKYAENNECPVQLVLACSLLKRDRFEWLLEKATEVGAARIIPLLAERTVAKLLPARWPGRLERWNRIVLEAAQQSCRSILPVTNEPTPLSVLLGTVGQYGWAVMPCIAEKNADLAGQVQARPNAASILICIGPEGGFTREEVAAAQKAGVMTVSLGKRRLKSETAALAALITIQEHLIR